MNYYIKYENRTMGPFSQEQIQNLFLQDRFDDSVRLSTNLSQWYAPNEISDFHLWIEQHPLRHGNNTSENAPQQRRPEKTNHSPKNHNFLFFMPVYILIILGFVAFIFWLNKNDNTGASSRKSSAQKTGDTAEAYQLYQNAIALVTMTFVDKEGNIKPVPIGTAFAISPNTFVTNAHVAFAVKNGYSKALILPILQSIIADEAEENNMSFDEYCQQIGDRGIDRRRDDVNKMLKSQGVKVRDIELRINHSRGKSFRVAKVQVNPFYNISYGNGEFDVAIFTIDGKTDCYFNVASDDELLDLIPGVHVASAGFPMEGLSDLNYNSPEASYAVGIIKKLTNFEFVDGGPQNNRSITHDIPGAGGASGSPMFTADGKVIGVLWGVTHAIDGGGRRTPSGVLHNYAVRIDQIKQMTEPVPWKEWVNE